MKQLVLLYKAIHAVDLQILKINCTKKEGKRRCVRRGGGGEGGCTWCTCTPTCEKSSAQKCPEEERKFRPDMSAKKKCTFLSDTTKLKRKR